MKSWAPEVFVEGKWTGNGLRFATKDEAERWGNGLLTRWFVPSDNRAVESEDRPNYRLGENSETLFSLCSVGGCGLDAIEKSDLCRGHHRMAVGDPSAEIAPNN